MGYFTCRYNPDSVILKRDMNNKQEISLFIHANNSVTCFLVLTSINEFQESVNGAHGAPYSDILRKALVSKNDGFRHKHAGMAAMEISYYS